MKVPVSAPASGEDDAIDAPRRGKGVGAIDLSLPRHRALRLAIAGGLLGFPGLGLWVALLPTFLLAGSLSRGAEHALLALVAPLTFAISIALPVFLLRMRAPRPARVTWDAWGITEHDGPHVRTAIAWRDALAAISVARGSRLVQVRDGAGRAITLASGKTPRWLSRRRATADDAALEPLVDALASVDPAAGVTPDARDSRRPTMGPQVAIATVLLGVLGAPTMWLAADMRHLAPAFGALIVCLLCAAPALRPFHELLELLADGRRLDRSEEATIEEEGEGTEALLRRHDGSLVRVDLGPARHPDADLAMREGTVLHVVLPAAGWAPAPSRVDVGPAVPADAVETAADREARAALGRAAGIELAARGAAVLWWGAASLSPLWR